MVGPDGLEPSTPRLSSACSNQLSYEPKIGEVAMTDRHRGQFGGAGEIRTRDPLLAKQMLYQLSYDPEIGRLCCKEPSVLDIYFVRSTETRTPKFPSTIEDPTEVGRFVSLKRR
jgi:hypothetical protein